MPKCPKDCHKPNPPIFRKAEIPAVMGDDKTYPPENGAYCNALVIYQANNAMYIYTSDGIPVKLPSSITSYNDLTDKPMINGVEIVGDVTLEELGIAGLIGAEAEARAAADEALQDAIDAETAAREAADENILDQIPTVNDAILTIQRNGVAVASFTANDANDVTANIEVPIYTSGLINDSGYITDAALGDYYTKSEVDTAIQTETTARENADAAIQSQVTQNTSDIAANASAIAAEATTRANADQDLQAQIDAIASSSDVVDVVGTYAELQAYDTSKLKDNDIIKVLSDSTHDNAITYYRWDDANDQFTYIGSQGPFYTKSEADSTFVPQTRTVNGKALTSDITLTAADVSALPASTVIPTVNDATLTIRRNGTAVQTFTANQATNVTADIAVPTKTSDLTNDSNFVEDASYVHTDNNFTTALKTKLDNIESGAEVNVQSDWNVTDSTSDAYIKNKPTIPTVNNGTLTIQRNGTTLDTFTANQAGNTEIDVSVPTKTSDLTNDSGYISTLPIASANTLGAIKVGANLSIAADGTLSADAQSITVDSALSPTSTNPVENRVINTALDAKANTADLADVATSGDYDDLLNKPTIPTVNDATITIQRNSATVDSFTVNASQNKSINIVVPTKTSDLTNDSNFATTAQIPTKTSDLTNDGSDGTSTYVEANGLATVATSGSYADLSNRPTIGNATLTIQKNGTNVQTFTANATSNKTANITVPTKTSDLTNDSNFVSNTDYATATTGGVVKVGGGLEITNGVLSATGGGTADAVEWDNVLNKPTFSTVATSGSYNDLTNKPTIPTVNDATLTIQKNGTNVAAFTANASSNVTANISVPTTSVSGTTLIINNA